MRKRVSVKEKKKVRIVLWKFEGGRRDEVEKEVKMNRKKEKFEREYYM